MSFKIVVLAKQVPDTRNVGKDAMKEDGTINRSALPAIYNPEDLNALEFALKIKDKIEGAEVQIVTMGPPRAAEIIRESMFRGADGGYLVSGREFAGSDTLATSYAISMAVKQLYPVDVIVAGRQAIDGDTAQVGPQVAEKLGVPQITYAEGLVNVTNKNIVVKRRLERGVEEVKSTFPVLITVHASAEPCRFRDAKRLMKFKNARTVSELAEEEKNANEIFNKKPYLRLNEMTVVDIKADVSALGLSGSPTKVKKIENVVFKAKDSLQINDNDEDINNLVKSLIDTHIIG